MWWIRHGGSEFAAFGAAAGPGPSLALRPGVTSSSPPVAPASPVSPVSPSARFVRASLVGLVATAVDLFALAALVELGRLSPALANVPALLAGLLVQFLGCRYVVFAGSRQPLAHQLVGFAAAEAGALALNAALFHVLVSWTPIPYALARPAGQLVVFVAFSFPAWSRVFAAKPAQRSRAGGGTG